jgi:protein-S-isoprenylcysteine O-methyltransferase Ste14
VLAVIVRVFADTVLVAIVLFAFAGTLAWPRAWILIAALFLIRVATAITVFRVNPALLRERARLLLHPAQPRADKLILFCFMVTAFIGVPAVAALDIFHWHVSRHVPLPLAIFGLAMFAAGWVVIALALRANAFAVTVVRVQPDRKHVVVDTGPYSVVRHPMYAGNPMVTLGLSLWLGSYVAAVCAIIPLALLIVRIVLEERLLRRQLPGYSDYVERVRYRLVPGLW